MKLLLSLATILIFSVSSLATDRKIPFFEDKELTPYWPSETIKHSPAKVGKFKAIKHNEKILTQKDFQGHLSLINFFFVRCPQICPMMMKNVQRLQKAVGKEMDKVQIYSFSVQPKSDTPEKLRSYAKDYKIDLTNWTLLTGEKKEIYHVGKNMFKADGSVGTQKSENTFIHTQNIYLVDENLNIRGIYDTSDSKDMKQLKEDIGILNRVKQSKLASR